MKIRQIQDEGGDILIHADLADPNIELDVTSDPWFLGDAASMILGRDVIHAGRIAPDSGRMSLGLGRPYGADATTGIVRADAASMYGLTSVRYSDVFTTETYDARYYDATGSTSSSLMKKNAPYAWPSEMVGGYIYKNSDQRTGDAGVAKITSISTTTQTNDTLNYTPAFAKDWYIYDKFSILYQKSFDKRGVWVTNGRKFWLLNSATWTLYLDLGSDTYLGESWRACRISYRLVMFCNYKYPSRIVRLCDSSISSSSDNGTLAGLIPPIKTENYETTQEGDGNANKSWLAAVLSSGGSIADNTSYKIKVRAINVDDGSESRFVDVWNNSDKDSKTITITGGSWNGNLINVFNEILSSDTEPPPLHERWTHIEIWRTTNGGANYYRERLIEIAGYPNERDDAPPYSSASIMLQSPRDYSTSSARATPCCYMSDTVLAGQTLATANDLLAGYQPPVCKDAVSIQGITICAGSASPSATNPVAYSRNFATLHQPSITTSYTNSSRELTVSGSGVVAIYNSYTFSAGDELVIAYSTEGVTGVYPIESKTSSTVIVLASPGPGQDLTGVQSYIRKAYTIDWPKIGSDEEIWYSRSDKFAPESFQIVNSDGSSRIIRLSSSGDTFKRIIAAKNYAVVVMLDAVHILYIDGTTIGKDTIGNGIGTPWPDSVVTWENYVAWARPEGVMVMGLSNSPDDKGHRGTVTMLPASAKMRAWFEAANTNGETIDAAVDQHNGCLRFRRKIDANTYQVFQWSYRTQLGTLLDDDNGVSYVSSNMVESSALPDALLYTVTKNGNVFLVNAQATTDAYAGATVQAIASVANGYTVTTTSITKTGAFSTKMLGDVVRFRSATSSVNGVSRVITSATANAIGFDAVSGLAAGDEFIIGATRFRMTFPPYVGTDQLAVKTIVGCGLVALPGSAHDTGKKWASCTPGAFSVRSYRNYDDAAVDDNDREIPVFDEDDNTYVSKDRVSSIEATGNAVTVEIENIESRTDFRIASVTVDVDDTAVTTEDSSTTD